MLWIASESEQLALVVVSSLPVATVKLAAEAGLAIKKDIDSTNNIMIGNSVSLLIFFIELIFLMIFLLDDYLKNLRCATFEPAAKSRLDVSRAMLNNA